MSDEDKTGETVNYSRREALAALTKYSAAVGGAAIAVVTADGLVSEASAYNARACANPGRKPQCPPGGPYPPPGLLNRRF